MLSRTADNLYWLARYVERAEYLARILEATQRLTSLPIAYVRWLVVVVVLYTSVTLLRSSMAARDLRSTATT